VRVVIALGGNALLRRGERPDAAPQVDQVAHVAGPLAALAREHEVVIVHGNGPQVGLLALESAADRSLTRPYPLGDLVAETQGLIGYWLQQAISRHLSTPVVTLVTQTVVDGRDPAFEDPTKFVGSVYTEDEAKLVAEEHDWDFAQDGEGWRRVVASPLPQRIVETETAELLLRSGVTVVSAGGGGVPVTESPDGLKSVEAVVDKDLVAALLAAELTADLLVILTDVPAVMADFGTPRQRPIHDVSVSELQAVAFPTGSMGPKVQAVCQFVRATGRRAAIGSLENVAAVFAGTSGTQVRQ
jgi:carbamate kinase